MKNKILVVDDDPNILELVSEYLIAKPYELIFAPNGKRAITLAAEEQPDLIIMDWEMPVLNGIEAVKEILDNPVTHNIPIIITTGVNLEPTDLEEALNTGAVDFLRKPYSPIEFIARLKANIRIRDQHQTITELLKKEKEHIRLSLEKKEREQVSAAMFEHEKNSVILKLIEELDKLTTDSNSKISIRLNDIKRQLKNKLDLSKSWNNFKVRFEEVHPDFFETLHAKFDFLNLNEKRMCAYLKIGLGNKEIATLTNVESGSVRKSLNRLKKKLQLQPEDNLREYVSYV